MPEENAYEGIGDEISETQPCTQLLSPEEEAGPSQSPNRWGILVSTNPDHKNVNIETDSITFGRHPNSTVVFDKDDTHVSARHCELYRVVEETAVVGGVVVFVKDLSANGTFINQVKIGKGNKAILNNGDTLTLVGSGKPGGLKASGSYIYQEVGVPIGGADSRRAAAVAAGPGRAGGVAAASPRRAVGHSNDPQHGGVAGGGGVTGAAGAARGPDMRRTRSSTAAAQLVASAAAGATGKRAAAGAAGREGAPAFAGAGGDAGAGAGDAGARPPLERLAGVAEVARTVRMTGHSQLDMDPIDIFYDMRDTLGTGNFSTVRLGVHRETGRKYAVKVINKTKFLGQPTFKKSVREEIGILTRIEHPGVISIKEVFESKLRLYMVLELVDGGELFDHIIRESRLKEPMCRDLLGQMLEAVEYLHSRGIVHRDLKPENVLLSRRRDGSLHVKITDFGLSKMVGGKRMMQTLCGTPQYLAPELIKHSKTHEGYDKAVDMWALGVILYIMLSGRPPFCDHNQAKLFSNIREGNYDFKHESWLSISDAAKDLITGLLQLDPARRLTTEAALSHPWFSPSRFYRKPCPASRPGGSRSAQGGAASGGAASAASSASSASSAAAPPKPSPRRAHPAPAAAGSPAVAVPRARGDSDDTARVPVAASTASTGSVARGRAAERQGLPVSPARSPVRGSLGPRKRIAHVPGSSPARPYVNPALRHRGDDRQDDDDEEDDDDDRGSRGGGSLSRVSTGASEGAEVGSAAVPSLRSTLSEALSNSRISRSVPGPGVPAGNNPSSYEASPAGGKRKLYDADGDDDDSRTPRKRRMM